MGGEAQMDIEILELMGFAFAATAFATMAFERRRDVLYGPYIQGRARGLSLKRFWRPASSAIDRFLELESQRVIYAGSISAC
jgi:hypothetical protein